MKCALKRGMLLGPEGTKDANTLIAIGAPSGIGLQPEGLEFFLHPADANPKGNPPVREDVEGGQRFGRKHRIPVGQNNGRCSEPNAFRDGGGIAQGDERLVKHFSVSLGLNIGKQDVICNPDGIEPNNFSVLGYSTYRFR